MNIHVPIDGHLCEREIRVISEIRCSKICVIRVICGDISFLQPIHVQRQLDFNVIGVGVGEGGGELLAAQRHDEL